MVLSNEYLMNVSGGGVGKWIIIGGVVTFLVGVVDGFLRPLKCNK